ncbi:hypothetical protein CAPTEDRAFT_206516 [Capitella teleta]|uniref:Uncharacterized protein n=1 Tax=Capitella teleta TaxID=283909 RepID=R7UMV8_CAPTE|nr:hypothetical protein CAPTEDRAFT_206516 [Capitella teleta]|eukprot:ELU07428.1 hypothetical protein CAPTEDRAFT_206516 [Capitella teleta]
MNFIRCLISHSVNIVDVKEKKFRMLSIENAPDSTKKRSFINVHEVKDSSSYFHVNLYRNLEVDQRPNHITSSKHRTKRIKEFLPPQTIRDVLKILGDTADVVVLLSRPVVVPRVAVLLPATLSPLMKDVDPVLENRSFQPNEEN